LPGEEIHPLVGRICQLVDETNLTPSARLAALLEAAWALAGSFP
jgi:hypothetical protein